jgi:hypothetical protein
MYNPSTMMYGNQMMQGMGGGQMGSHMQGMGGQMQGMNGQMNGQMQMQNQNQVQNHNQMQGQNQTRPSSDAGPVPKGTELVSGVQALVEACARGEQELASLRQQGGSLVSAGGGGGGSEQQIARLEGKIEALMVGETASEKD